MKTYKYDESLNYDDLTHSDISDKGKGYGPCYYANPDCTCYTSSGWIQLYVGCLANGCPNHKSPFSWVHTSCSNPMYISTDLELKCVRCNEPSHMKNWFFNCHQPRHPGGYEKTSAASFQNALSYMNASISNRVPEVRNKTKAIVMKMLEEQGW